MLDAQKMLNMTQITGLTPEITDVFPDAEFVRGDDTDDIVVFHPDKSALFINDDVVVVLSEARLRELFPLASPGGMPPDGHVAVDRLGRYLRATDYDINTIIIDGCKVKRNDDNSVSIINNKWRGELSLEQAVEHIPDSRFIDGHANEIIDYLAINNIGTWHQVDNAGA